ncbi:27746_t:CDS:2, partial [Gigaspora margarita]
TRATEKTFKYTTKRHLRDNRLTQLLDNDKLKALYGDAIENLNESQMWSKLSEYGKKDAFKTDKTFSELAKLMLQIKEIQEHGKSKRELRYSEHLHHFFSLLSDSSREYSIFRKILDSIDPRSIRYLRVRNSNYLTNPNLMYENVARFAPKLTYLQELGYIIGSTLNIEDTNILTYDDIHLKIKEIQDNNLVVSQVRCIVLKIPISKIPLVIIALLPTKAESLVLLILAHRDYYPNHLFFPCEHGTEALEHLFGISRQLMPDFSYYELYKILNRVQHRDNILHSENISNIQEKKPASDYIFDFNTSISEIDIDNYMKIDFLIPETNNQPESKVFQFQIQTIDQAVDELKRTSQLDDILDVYFENNNTSEDLNDELNHEFVQDLLEVNITEVENFIEKTEINYINNNSYSKASQELDYKYKEKIFRDNGSCDIFLMLELRKSHEAFSCSDRSHRIQTQSINLNQESQTGINQNLANYLVNQLTSNQNHQIIKQRTQHCTNISNTHLLEKGSYLLVWTNGMLCVAKTLAMYQLIGGKHSFISGSVDNFDSLSYISVLLFINIYGNTLFSNECMAGEKLYAHLKLQEIVYYFGISTSFIFHSNSLLTLDQDSLNIYLFFNEKET